MFKSSFISDLIEVTSSCIFKLLYCDGTNILNSVPLQGMLYIHSGPLKSHGNLKSSNCLVDSRWLLKITGHGLKAFRTDPHKDQTEYEKYRDQLWTAPEILRQGPTRSVYGTQKGDVYSFAIILQEIIHRMLPFFIGDHALNPKGQGHIHSWVNHWSGCLKAWGEFWV